MERSDPAMLSRLLELGVDPTENDAVGNPFKQTKKHKPKFSVAESMVWANYSNFVSWQIGPPDEKDFVRCFLMLLDHGAEFKPPPALLRETKFMLGNVQVSSIRLAPDDDERARPTALSNAARFTHSVALTPQPLPRQRKYLSGEFRPDLKLALARAAVAHDTKRLQSLREKGEKTQAGIDKRSRKAREKASTEGYALASDAIGEIWGGPSFRGPRAMTEEQLQVECKAHSLPLGGRGSMERAVLRVTSTNVNAGGSQELHVEVGDTHPICRGLAGHQQMTLPSSGGPVLITASVNGVRTDCFLSTTSTFTVLSTDFAERAGIPSSSLTSDAFRCNGAPLDKARRLRGVRVRLGDVEIPIRTAIAAQGLSRDVQFGMDFFAQAVHAQIDVFVQDGWLVHMLPAHGSNHCRFDTKPPRDAREELRFHAEGGGIAVLPIRHEDRKHMRDAYSSTVHIAPNKRMDTCAICGELWPGMALCEGCWDEEDIRVTFCSKECARAHEHKPTTTGATPLPKHRPTAHAAHTA